MPDRPETPTTKAETARLRNELEQVQQALEITREQLRRTQKIAKIGSWSLDFSNNKLRWSDTTHEIFGVAPDAFSGAVDTVLANHIHPDDRKLVEQAHQVILENQSMNGFEYRVIRPDGEIRHIWGEGEALTDAQGHVIGLFGTVQDITERKRAEAELQASEHRFRSLFESAADAIFIIEQLPEGKPGKILEANRSACELLGYSLTELRKLTPLDLSENLYGGRVAEVYRELSERGESQFETRLIAKDGSLFPMEFNVRLARIDNRPVRLSIGRDITERRRSENAILQAIEREQHRIGQDIHDSLVQQLTGIHYISQLLEQQLAETQRPEADSARVINQLIRESITQARNLSHGLYPKELETDGIVTGLAELAQFIQEIYGIPCRFVHEDSAKEHAGKLPLTLEMQTHLYRVAQEALHNAVRHAHPKQIDIRFVWRDDMAELHIEDDGVGIEPGQLESSGIGLRSMRYRAQLIGASLEIGRGCSGGTQILCRIKTSLD